MLREQKVYASQDFGAERKVMNSSLLLRGESDEDEEKWVVKVLLLFCCDVGGEER